MHPQRGRRTLKRLLAISAITTVLAGAVADQALAGPVRSGAVLGGPIDTGPSTSCAVAVECAAFLASGCQPALAGHDPAIQTSIVDVEDLAGRSVTRRFVVRPGAARGVEAGLVIGGFVIEFWKADCEEVDPARPIFDESRTYFPWYIRTSARFKIPAGAAWMTAAADDNVLIRWELY
jgi:hypothetical protein